jgi:hypothetical protein
MRKFKKQIFMGNSSPKRDGRTDTSIKVLKKLLDKAVSNLSASQQLEYAPFDILEKWTSKEITKELLKYTNRNKRIVQDIAMAILGENIEFVRIEQNDCQGER